MKFSADQYHQQLKALLPRGAAWPDEDGTVICSFLAALAEEFARINARSFVLIEESDPRTTAEMLSDWERAYGLPDPCTESADTLQERLNVLFQKVTKVGGQSRQYFIDVAAALGFEITITEFRPFNVISGVDEPLYDAEWRFAWRVNAPEETVRCFNVNSGVDEPLCDWGNDILECIINRLKPAHTKALFSYGG